MEKMEDLIPFKTSGQSWLKKIKQSSKKPTNSILALIILVASFMRLYKISEYMTFLGDEGRDAIVAKEILEGNLTLLGPRASAGDFFLGPIYYYMMAPFLAVFDYDPVGPAVMVALIGIATVFLVYFVTSRFFGSLAGLVASSLYAISPVVIAFSRSSWNPNPVPFFALLMLYVLYLSVKKQNLKWSFVAGVILGITLQLHYIATFLGVIIFVFVLIGNLFIKKINMVKSYIYQYLSIFAGFIVGFSPFLVFEVRHGFPNIRTIFNFVFVDNFKEERVEQFTHLEIIQDVLFRLYARLTLNFPPPEQLAMANNLEINILQVATYLLIGGSLVSLFMTKKRLVITLMLVWFLGGVFLFGFYKREIYDYYYGFMFPVPFILIGGMISKITNFKGKIRMLGIFVGALVFGFLFYALISNHPFQYEPNNQKGQAEEVANFILDKTNGEPFNFALLSHGNSDHLYRYFFEINGRAPIVIENPSIDPERNSVTDQLFVICDIECEPVGHSLWEIAGFGAAEIEDIWDVSFFTVYKLVPVEDEN